ncbi:hypothetical protein GTO91_09810, partial [Heliobacterium undosum]
MGYDFWRKWLFGFGLAFTFFGILLAFFNQTPLFDFLFNNQVNPVFWSSFPLEEPLHDFQAWIYGVLGATCAGWGIFIAFLAVYPLAQREQWAIKCIFIGITLWFVIDTSISLIFHVIFNALFNVLLLMLIIVPLLMMRKELQLSEKSRHI